MMTPGPPLSILLSLEFASFAGRPSPCSNKDGPQQYQAYEYIILEAREARERGLPFPPLASYWSLKTIHVPQSGPQHHFRARMGRVP